MRRGEVSAEVLNIAEIDADDRVAASIQFDPDDIDAAFEELDARYLAGEAAPYSDTWSVITRGYAALNRREIPATSQDWVNIDHRRSTTFEPGDLPAYIRALWDVASDVTVYVETVHRVSDFGALVSSAHAREIAEGFDAEWPEINLLTVNGDRISRCEIFDEADVDAALARFDELSRPVPQLENDASRADDRFGRTSRPATGTRWRRCWPTTFRRRSPSGREHRDPTRSRCRDREHAGRLPRSGAKAFTSDVIAIRGGRLALSRIRASGRDQRPEAFHTDVLGIVEINADEPDRGASRVRPRRHGGRHRGARRPLPRRRSRRPRTHVVSHRAGLRRVQPARISATTPDYVNIDHRRARNIDAGRHELLHPCRVGSRAGLQRLHRDSAPAERPRSGVTK